MTTLITLSLLKNIKELDEVKIKLLPLPILNDYHKEWLKNQFSKYSKQFSCSSPRMEGPLVIFWGLL